MTARSHRKAVVLIVLACVAVVSVAFGYPRPVSHPILGDGWQCTRMAFLTSCTRTNHGAPQVGGLPLAPAAFRHV
jgi:hypothetical protein